MEIDPNTVKIIVGIVLIGVIIYLFFNKPTKSKEQPEEKTSQNGIIYGVMSCPYTVKQVEKYPDYEFVDCSSGNCPDFVTAFPTTKFPDGDVKVGFS